MSVINFNIDFIQEECCRCGCFFYITKQLNNNLQKTKNLFYCPNGHAQSYSKSTADKLQEEIDKKDIEIFNLKHNLEVAYKNNKKRKK